MKNLKHVQIELEEKRADIKSIDEHEWCSAVYYVEDGIEGVKIFYDGDYDYLEISNDGLAVLAKARGFDLIPRGDTNE